MMQSFFHLSDFDSSCTKSEHRRPKISGSIYGTDNSSSPLHNFEIDTGARQTLVQSISIPWNKSAGARNWPLNFMQYRG